MSKKKYFYNQETLSYEPVKVRKPDIIIGGIALVILVFLFSFLISFLYSTYFDTPVEAELRKENKALEYHLASIRDEQTEVDKMLGVLKKRDQLIYGSIYEGSTARSNLNSNSVLNGLEKKINTRGFNPEIVDEFSEKINLINKKASDNSLNDLTRLTREKIKNIEELEALPTLQPIENPNLTSLVSGFGKRMNPFHHGIMDHHGLDFTAPEGTMVRATGKGTVISVKTAKSNTGYGNLIDIDHGNGLISRYTHLGEILVKKGQDVQKGEKIGTTGISGGTIAPSVHYEIIRNGKKIDPVNFFIQELSEKEFLSLLELSKRENQSLD